MVIDRLKRLFSKKQGISINDITRLKALPSDKGDRELQTILYEIAFNNAAEFVHEELTRHESPFKGLQRDLFFNEVLIINFWMMDKVFSKYQKNLAERLHNHYFGSLPDFDQRAAALQKKLNAYNFCWDEYTGHHDEFGLKAGEVIFGKDTGFPEKQVSFWIISYADKSLKEFRKIRKQCSETGLVSKGELHG